MFLSVPLRWSPLHCGPSTMAFWRGLALLSLNCVPLNGNCCCHCPLCLGKNDLCLCCMCVLLAAECATVCDCVCVCVSFWVCASVHLAHIDVHIWHTIGLWLGLSPVIYSQMWQVNILSALSAPVSPLIHLKANCLPLLLMIISACSFIYRHISSSAFKPCTDGQLKLLHSN